MSYDFNAYDVLEIAEKIEENGILFYEKASMATNDKSNKKFLLNLALMEKEHKNIFSNIKEKLSEKEKKKTIFDPNQENISYIKALADIRVFFKKKMDLSSMKKILEFAILSEKDSILFYIAMKKLVPETLGKYKIDDIIKEEMNHIQLLTKKFSII